MAYKDKEKQKEYLRLWYLRNKDKRKQYNYKKQQRRKKELRERLIKYKKILSCVDCGKQDFRVIDFHHINSKEKKFNVGDMTRKGYSWKNMMKEIKKCIPLCSNCHRIRTYEEKYK